MFTSLDSWNHGSHTDGRRTGSVDMQRPAGVARVALGSDGPSPSGSHLFILSCQIYLNILLPMLIINKL